MYTESSQNSPQSSRVLSLSPNLVWFWVMNSQTNSYARRFALTASLDLR